ncbi:hypothetical protein PC41400_27680 [Paenibacillus chitinolyticus]|uniref:Uncharacterized protein n=1 Tax=Paenibacillus chitinolyticus TaxID=79263 RepID=A0A410X3S2_9BACL|nr:hypothetical protein PC41400_27680 [Paenibacillus chitinolyticus]
MTFCAFFRLKSPSSSSGFIGTWAWKEPFQTPSSFNPPARSLSCIACDRTGGNFRFAHTKKPPGYPGGSFSFHSISGIVSSIVDFSFTRK